MDVQCSLIQDFTLYVYKLDHNTVEAAKNISCTKSESAVDHSINLPRWFKEFCSGCKNLDDQTKPKSIDFEAMLQTIEAKSESIRQD